ncbi:ANTAR domain-containing protein [Williamsia muralis]|uniref:ANTAR domain-containing protein n=1 Tax=Williamsia marianensis TaxID=85044 RepID=UPI000DE7AE65|nr:ANTAR domain-containing protein [Williamsia marianensis]PVY23215.1 ANTAR domain-containing protein [Williamsia marianensis]
MGDTDEPDIHRALSEQHSVAVAVGMLMQRDGQDQPAALRQLRQIAHTSQMTMFEAASLVINTQTDPVDLPGENNGNDHP